MLRRIQLVFFGEYRNYFNPGKGRVHKMDNQILNEKLSKFIYSVRDSISNENWYAALTVTLALPDICGKLEHPNFSSSKRYVRWFDEYMLKKYSMEVQGNKTVFITGRDAYSLRCSFLHGGESDITEQQKREVLEEFIFMTPKKQNGNFTGSHKIRIDDKLVLRIDLFCNDICQAVETWISRNEKDHRIQESANKMIEIYLGEISVGGVHIS